MSIRPVPSLSDSLQFDERRRFYEQYRSVAIGMIVVVFLAPFVGLLMSGLAGVVCAVLLSAVGYYLTPYIVLKVQSWLTQG